VKDAELTEDAVGKKLVSATDVPAIHC
jgi:hypothetical protein